MREKQIEQKLVQEVKKRGGICPKFVSPGFAGMPDRLILLPGGRLAFAELKAPGQKPRPLQKARHALLRRLGFLVLVIDGIAQVKTVLDSLNASESVQDALQALSDVSDRKVYPKKQKVSDGRSGACTEVMPDKGGKEGDAK